MNLSDDFFLTVTGNHSDINDSIGVNESDFGVKKQRYGTGDDVVAQRMAAWWAAHAQNVTVSNVTNVSVNVTPNVSPVIPPPVSPVVKPVEAPVESPPAVQPPQEAVPVPVPVPQRPVENAVVRHDGGINMLLVAVTFLTVIFVGGVVLYMLREVM
jgi:hypothetical protein